MQERQNEGNDLVSSLAKLTTSNTELIVRQGEMIRSLIEQDAQLVGFIDALSRRLDAIEERVGIDDEHGPVVIDGE